MPMAFVLGENVIATPARFYANPLFALAAARLRLNMPGKGYKGKKKEYGADFFQKLMLLFTGRHFARFTAIWVPGLLVKAQNTDFQQINL